MDKIRDMFLAYQNEQEMTQFLLSVGFQQTYAGLMHEAMELDPIGPIVTRDASGNAVSVDDRFFVNIRCMDPKIDLEVYRPFFVNVRNPKRVFSGGMFPYK